MGFYIILIIYFLAVIFEFYSLMIIGKVWLSYLLTILLGNSIAMLLIVMQDGYLTDWWSIVSFSLTLILIFGAVSGHIGWIIRLNFHRKK